MIERLLLIMPVGDIQRGPIVGKLVFLDGESSEQVQRLVVVDLPGALPLETLAWSPVE